jgi:hypothetical protein
LEGFAQLHLRSHRVPVLSSPIVQRSFTSSLRLRKNSSLSVHLTPTPTTKVDGLRHITLSLYIGHVTNPQQRLWQPAIANLSTRKAIGVPLRTGRHVYCTSPSAACSLRLSLLFSEYALSTTCFLAVQRFSAYKRLCANLVSDQILM